MGHFVCPLKIGVLHQTIFMPDGGAARFATANFASSLMALVHDYECYLVDFIGNEEYCRGIMKRVHEYNIREYGHSNVELVYKGEK